MRDKAKLIDAPERRAVAVTEFEIRRDGNSLSLAGYASVFDAAYDVYGGPVVGGWSETVKRQAFDKTLREKPDLHLLINHEGMPLARTKSGTLRLSTDSKGLLVEAPDLDRRDPDVQRLEVKMERGDMDEMSFAFRTKKDTWADDDSKRDLLEVSLHKGDVSVVNFGANPATSVQLNSMTEALDFLTTLEPAQALTELRSGGSELATRLQEARASLDQLHDSLYPPAARPRLQAAKALLAEL